MTPGSIGIECSHPRDERRRIGDQVSIVNNVDRSELPGGLMPLVVLSVTSSTAKVHPNGAERTVGAGATIWVDR